MNTADFILICLLAVILIRAFIVIHNDRKKGNGCLGCSGKCSGCSYQCNIKEYRQ